MKFGLNEHKRNIPNDMLIEDIKHIAKKLNQNKLTTAAYKANGGKYSLDTYSK